MHTVRKVYMRAKHPYTLNMKTIQIAVPIKKSDSVVKPGLLISFKCCYCWCSRDCTLRTTNLSPQVLNKPEAIDVFTDLLELRASLQKDGVLSSCCPWEEEPQLPSMPRPPFCSLLLSFNPLFSSPLHASVSESLGLPGIGSVERAHSHLEKLGHPD